MSDIETRLARLESVVEDQQDRLETQQHRIEDQQSTITTQQEIIDAQRERIAALEVDGSLGSMSRRGALAAGGALGLLGLGVGTASASPSGQVGTAGRPLEAVHTQRINFAEVDDSFANITSDGDFLEFSLGVYEDEKRVFKLEWNDDEELSNVIAGTEHVVGEESGVTIGGGYFNRAKSFMSTISGGQNNETSGSYATIGGGIGNEAEGVNSAINGGTDNKVEGNNAAIPGGSDNRADGDYSFAVGRAAEVDEDHDGAFIVGDSSGDSIESTRPDQARFQMNVGANAFELLEKRDEPGTDELADGEGMLYIREATGGKLKYSFNDDGEIDTFTVAGPE